MIKKIFCFSVGLLLITSGSFVLIYKSDLADCKLEQESMWNQINNQENEILHLEKDKNGLLENEFLPESVIMNVPKYEQTHNASCESASAHAAMLYFGIDVPENQIISEIGTDFSPRYFDDEGKLHWGDPQSEFVGGIDGEEVYVDGYGVYNKPVYNAMKNNGFASSISKTGWDVNELYKYIRRGYPAVVWISNDYQTKDVGVMVSSNGVENPWMYKEHAVVVRGVDDSNVYIMDVGNGSYYQISYEKFERGFANLNNMGIVVIKD